MSDVARTVDSPRTTGRSDRPRIPVRPRRSTMDGGRRESVVSHALLVIASLVALYPFAQILLVALHEPGARVTGFSVPSSLHFDNFATAWHKGLFSSALVSSLLVAVCVVVLTLLVSVPAGYAFASFTFPLKGPLMGILLIGLVLPYEATVIPLYYQLKAWGLLDTYWALILPQVGLSLALGTFWMRNFFAGVPGSLREAAEIDGATRFQTLRKIMLPLAAPAITALAALLFLYAWNEFLLALVLVPNNPDVRTAPLALSFFTSDRRNSDPGVTSAAAVLVALPVLIGYVLLQRKFISGMLSGAVKG
ncbi:carbohydrate ABC transporter permease [Streptomyces sp. NBC_01186]|uniref:carbohydrate ABC transporter permease n=1 Tax=unclassified Streptomyces TaxID=2593676 RepID=UPI002DDC00A1|nr:MULTISPECIES: carbohydrate ABC transporter permease [unclassified Streptomyces]WSB78735.1 carbohydrate ABC transporter permease [Streptomyces sp. NBC_01775]WSS13061.1 carbohydrate ABC transporter permease [Streptomyces sp. NBC_01186]